MSTDTSPYRSQYLGDYRYLVFASQEGIDTGWNLDLARDYRTRLRGSGNYLLLKELSPKPGTVIRGLRERFSERFRLGRPVNLRALDVHTGAMLCGMTHRAEWIPYRSIPNAPGRFVIFRGGCGAGSHMPGHLPLSGILSFSLGLEEARDYMWGFATHPKLSCPHCSFETLDLEGLLVASYTHRQVMKFKEADLTQLFRPETFTRPSERIIALEG